MRWLLAHEIDYINLKEDFLFNIFPSFTKLSKGLFSVLLTQRQHCSSLLLGSYTPPMFLTILAPCRLQFGAKFCQLTVGLPGRIIEGCQLSVIIGPSRPHRCGKGGPGASDDWPASGRVFTGLGHSTTMWGHCPMKRVTGRACVAIIIEIGMMLQSSL